MKALTLHQPWASLVARGVKRIETRSWSTEYRGPLAIHAGTATNHWVKKDGRKGCNGCGERYWDHLASPVPMGAVVATCTLADVVPTEAVTWFPNDKISGGRHWGVGDQCAAVIEAEGAYGDYTAGRYAWLLNDIEPIEPVPARGRQGLWEWAGIADTETPRP